MSGCFAYRIDIELTGWSTYAAAHSHLTGTAHERTDHHQYIVHHGSKEHHESHDQKNDAGGFDACVLKVRTYYWHELIVE